MVTVAHSMRIHGVTSMVGRLGNTSQGFDSPTAPSISIAGYLQHLFEPVMEPAEQEEMVA